MRNLWLFCGLIVFCSVSFYFNIHVVGGLIIVLLLLFLLVNRNLLALFCCLVAIIVMMFRIYAFNNSVITEIDRVGGIGDICREVDYRREKINYTVCLEDGGKILLVADLYPRFNFGDRIEFTGRVTVPKQIDDFNYRNYLFRYGIGLVVYRPVINLVEEGGGLGNRLFSYKNLLMQKINSLYHQPYGSFLAGLLVGYRGGLPDDLLENFRLTGLTHVIAISGANIALVVLILEKFFYWISKGIRLWLILLILAVFCVFVGLGASVIRAAVMGGLILIARYHGRDVDKIGLILLVAALMVLFVPPIAAYDAGFQLSFCAVIGILVFGDFIKKVFWFLDDWPILQESVVMTLAAQIGTLPLSVLLFKVLPIHAFIVNVMVIPLLPVVMFFGAFSLFFAWLFLPTSILLSSIVFIVDVFARLEFLVINFNNFAAILFSIAVALITIFLGIRLWRVRLVDGVLLIG